MKKYFEIYLAGSSGFSSFVETIIESDAKPADVETIVLTRSVTKNIISGPDAKDIYNGNGFVKEIVDLEDIQSLQQDLLFVEV